MRDGLIQEPIELRLEQRQVAILAAGALILLGVVFTLGVLVGRQLASATLGAPQQPAPGDLTALDAAQRAPPPAPRIAPAEPKLVERADGLVVPSRPEPAAASAGASNSARESAMPAPAAASSAAKPAAAAATPAPPTAAPAPAKGPDAPPTPDEALEDDDAPAAPPPRAAAPKPAPSPAPARGASPKDSGNFTVQLGASPDRKVAEKIEARARAAGLNPYVIAVDLGAKGTWYRVRAGAFASREDAAKLQKDAERQLHAPAVIMPAK